MSWELWPLNFTVDFLRYLIPAFVVALVVPLIVLVVPMHLSALFVFLLYMIVMNVMGHAGIELFPSWFVRSRWTRWYSTSTHHNLHHRDFRGNYGLYFTWWDRALGTQHPAYLDTFEGVTKAVIDRCPSTALRRSYAAARARL